MRNPAWVVIALAGYLAAVPVASWAQPSLDWPMFQRSPAHDGVASGSAPAPALRRAWRTDLPGDQRLSPAVAVGGVAVAVGPVSVVGFDPMTGATEWMIDRARGALVPAAIDAQAGDVGVVVYSEGTTAADSALVAVDLSDQEDLWRVALDAPSRTAPTIDRGAVFVGTHDGTVHAVGTDSGEELWTFAARGRVDTAAAVLADLVYVVAEDFDDGVARLHAIDRTSGEEAWDHAGAVGSVRVSAPTVAGGKVVAGFGDFTVRAFDAMGGGSIWEARVRSVSSPVSASASFGGDVFAADRSGSLYRLDGLTGDRVWDHQLPSDNVRGSPLVADGHVYLGFDDGTLAAFEGASGDLRWRVTLPGPVGALAPAPGLLMVPSVSPLGGLFGYAHAADRPLVRMRSPTILRPGVAVANFVVAACVLVAGLLLLFSLVDRSGEGRPRTGGSRILRFGGR
jgi:outer membrane protein assembly factor BamB